MTDFNEPRKLADWLDAHPGEAPPEDVEAEVIEAVYALRPDLAPAPRVSLDDILAGVTSGPFARKDEDRSDEEALAFGSPWGSDLEFQLSATYDARAEVEEEEEEEEEEEVQVEPDTEHPSSDLDEVDPIVAADDELEATPIVGVTSTDPLAESVEEATDPGLEPFGAGLEGEDTNPSGRAPAFGVVDAPPPPELAPAEPPPSLRNRAVHAPPQSVGPLSSAGMPTNPPQLVSQDPPTPDDADEPIDTELSDEDPATEPPVAEVVDLTAHPRWSGRRLWGALGTVAAAALVLFIVVPSKSLEDAAMAPGRMASESRSVSEQVAAEQEAGSTTGNQRRQQVADVFQPNQRLDAPTRAIGGQAGGAPPPPPADAAAPAKDAEGGAASVQVVAKGRSSDATATPSVPAAEPVASPATLADDQDADGRGWGGAESKEDNALAEEEEWDEVPAEAFLEVSDEEAPMAYQPEPSPDAPLLGAAESAQGDWGVAASSSTPSSRERPRTERSEAQTRSGSSALDGDAMGILRESNPGTGPEPPPPHELDALRHDGKPSDYRSDWYLMTGNLPDATLERIRKTLQEADADTRLDDYAHAATVVARLVDDKDARVAQDFAGRAAAWYLVAGDAISALAIIAQGKARGSGNTAQLARLHYLEGKALEAQRKTGWAAESYLAAKTLNDAR